tara:strand:+ start:2152 stop:2586 length:435 start_codon:yes stop_codon:yes gene_type:complete
MVNKREYRSFEILDSVAAAKTKAEKIKILQTHNNHWATKDILRGTFDEAVKWLLPTGAVPYEPAPDNSHPSEWVRHNKQLQYFVEGGPGAQMMTVKREKMFLDIIETVHPRDAELIVGMINKKMPVKGITKKLVKEAYPDLILK